MRSSLTPLAVAPPRASNRGSRRCSLRVGMTSRRRETGFLEVCCAGACFEERERSLVLPCFLSALERSCG